jgi:uncharacterized membrane protein
VSRRLALLATVVTGLLLVAAPALAAEEAEAAAVEGQWTGLMYALVAGVIMGVLVFVDVVVGADDGGHDAHH